MIAVVTAGGVTQPGEPLYEVTQSGLKSMIEIAGKPMVQWVLDALSESDIVSQVVLVGLPLETDVQCKHRLAMVPDHGGMVLNIQAGAREAIRIAPSATHALLVSGDLPALRGNIIDWLVQETSGMEYDLCYTVVERATMEEQFPSSRRTYVRLKDGEYCGGDLHAFRLQFALDENPLWKRLINARKNPILQASLIGYDTILYLMLHKLSLQSAEAMVSKRMGMTARVVPSPYAETGMDVDKPVQLEMMREHLARRHEKHTAGTV